MYSSPDPPPAPDYVGAAEKQGEANLQATRSGSRLNNPNVFSPYGSQTITYGSGLDKTGYDRAVAQYNEAKSLRDSAISSGDTWASCSPEPTKPNMSNYIQGDPDIPTIRQEFSPSQQKLFDQTNAIKTALGGLGIQGAESLKGIVGEPVDFSGAPAMPGPAEDTRNKVIDSMMSRVDQDTAIAKDNLNSELIAAGIRPGSTAYDNKMHMIDRSYNDARNQAFLASGQEATRDFGMDSERRRQAITEMLSQRQIPLNEITALMSGSQVSNPFAMPGYGNVGSPNPAPYFAAQNMLSGYNTDLYNAETAAAANQQAGAMGLGSAAIIGGAMLF